MTKRFAIFLRHGDYHQRPNTPSAHQPFGLTGNGFIQAHGASLLLASMVRANGWRLHPVVHSAHLLRSWQTADTIRQDLGSITSVDQFEALAERSVGTVTNLTVDEIEHVLRTDPRYDAPPPHWKSDSHYCLPFAGAESLMQAGERVAAHVRTALATISDDNTAMVFVGHGAAFRHAAYVLGALAFDDIAKLSMYHAQPVAIQDLGDAPWCHVAGEWKVRQDCNSGMD